jgi:NAD(P)-dependent dehydrogenase (short-subunit alcohol dehydrogenase family)
VLLANRAAIVAGGAKGCGRGIALKFAKEGCSTVIADISATEGKATAEEISRIGGNCTFFQCDLTDSHQVQDMVNKAISEFGKIDILVNTAGGVKESHSGEGGIIAIDDEEWEWIINLNLKSTFLCCRAIVPHMQKNLYGKIINFSSIGTIAPNGSVIHYHAAKGGVLAMTTNLAYDLAPFNICVNAILPGPVRTPFWDPLTREASEADIEALF